MRRETKKIHRDGVQLMSLTLDIEQDFVSEAEKINARSAELETLEEFCLDVRARAEKSLSEKYSEVPTFNKAFVFAYNKFNCCSSAQQIFNKKLKLRKMFGGA